MWKVLKPRNDTVVVSLGPSADDTLWSSIATRTFEIASF
jgi:hypothetical protein